MKSLTRAVMVVAALLTLSVASAEACGRRGLFGGRSQCGQTTTCGQATVVRVQSAPVQVTPIPLPAKPADETKPNSPTPIPAPKKKVSTEQEDLSVEVTVSPPISVPLAVQNPHVITTPSTVVAPACNGPNCTGTTRGFRIFRR